MNMTELSPTPIIGIVGFSGSGKTTLLEQLIPLLRIRPLRLGVIKHAHHKFDIDTPGKDSYRHRQAGAEQVMVASGKRWALIEEHVTATQEPILEQLIPRLNHDTLDLILIEGFKHANFPKLELNRAATNQPWLYPDDNQIIGVITDQTNVETTLPVLDLNNHGMIIQFICSHQKQHNTLT
ncbi:MAG: molybdopterin-guanine dinucleotide biosynthesis protein B [Methylococcales bacterium]|nr:molybdopterin-guanine dinucleotide biosynthesis protein B [Methylococcales bacterium]MBT7443269.1 molybdopterin-guanine dinucleotide biosynthesis protein B [Methylococcales bacterium]